MTPEAQRIAIAEACGWERHEATHEHPVEKGGMRLPNYFAPGATPAWTHDKESGVYAYPPNYLNDLNAMHEAETKVLTDEQLFIYRNYLCDVAETNPVRGIIVPPFLATAAQRAEAFLRTLNLWKETDQ